ncbi:putative zinc protease [termite gut metagenome]|uniref:Putative zinc protease n=1 Tax=termite gut metagenome TaxID=433724 RepID=A0A5J4SMU6_9ZZZZ
MTLNRTQSPLVQPPDKWDIRLPVRTILPNGVPLDSINQGEQEVVRFDVFFEGGRWHQTQKLQALFTNRMLREGSHKYNSAEIAEKLDYYGAWLELSCSLEHSYITLYTLNKYFIQTLDILESMIKESFFPQKELETVRATNIRKFQVNLSKIEYVAQRRIMSAMYGERHPCGIPVEIEDYNKITPDMLVEFHNRYYYSGNCSLFISGKVTDEIIHGIESVFGTEPFGKNHSKPEVKEYSPLPASEKQIFVAHNEREMQTSVRLGQFIMTRQHPDYPKMRVLITLLGGYFGSRLMSNIREDKGYTYGISAETFFCPRSGLLLVSADTAPEYLQPLMKEIYFEIDRLQTELVTPQELSNVRNYMLGEMSRNYESAFSLSDAWIFIKNSGLDGTYFSRIVRAVKEITPTEIRDLACRYLCKENIKELVVGKFS